MSTASFEPQPNQESPGPLPRHIAIIMDGNGRWARQRGLPRVRGHQEGAESVRVVTTECARLGIERLTLYAFSLENWKRPAREIAFLMRLLKRFLIGERPTIMENNIRFTAMGRLADLPASVRRHLERNTAMSRLNTGLNLCLALSYSGRAELVDAARALAREAVQGRIRPDEIDEELLAQHLYQPGHDPDLLIRTAGERRISNFLLWQLSYAELYFADVCWPDFREAELHLAIGAYRSRTRTFGGLEPVVDPNRGL
ncbi:MAG: isoprenyl transferase [Planctomycetota bacterium]